jgi:hypothetical protein
MGTESKNLRDLLAGCITGNTITTNLTATDCIRTVINPAGDALNISIGGGSGSATFPGDVNIVGNLYVTGTTYEQNEYVVTAMYLGPKDQDGTWRFIESGGNLNVEKRIGGSYTPKGQFIGI